MLYTTKDAANALRMIFKGLGLLIVSLLYGLAYVTWYVIASAVRHPMEALTALLAIAVGIVFVPMLVACAWFLV